MTAPSYTVTATRFTQATWSTNSTIGIAALLIEPIGLHIRAVFIVETPEGLRVNFPKATRLLDGREISEKPLWFADNACWEEFSARAIDAIAKDFPGQFEEARRLPPVEAKKLESV